MSAVLLNGAFMGLLYGLLAIGIVVVYRGSHVINFAYAESGMIGAFLYTELRLGQDPFSPIDRGLWPALPAAVLASAALGAVVEWVVVRPLRNAPRLTAMVGTIAMAGLFSTFALKRWGAETRATAPLLDGAGWRLAGLNVSRHQLLILGVAIVVLVVLGLMYRYSSFGLRLRAVAVDPYAASLSGININASSLAMWAIAGGLAGFTAILIAPLQTFQVGFMGPIMIRAVAASLLGRLDRIGGAFAAGVLVGVVESVIAYRSPVTGMTEVVLGVLILGVALARPTRASLAT